MGLGDEGAGMSPESKHLIRWWKIWLERLVLTTYHLFNRNAYRKWKRARQSGRYENIELDEFGDGIC